MWHSMRPKAACLQPIVAVIGPRSQPLMHQSSTYIPVQSQLRLLLVRARSGLPRQHPR